jgi:site-specific recombinase XerD
MRLVESFFREHLHRVRGASRHTVLAYRDTLRLFFAFLADTRKCAVANLGVEDLTVERVIAFLDHLESDRGNRVATRNLRLIALRSFFRHLIRHDPPHSAQYQRVLSLPSKKARKPLVTYLEPEEFRTLLRQPDRRTVRGTRDYCLLLFLYNTGARIGEALAIRAADLQLLRPHQVQLHGKGRKDRICPLWPDTASALRRLISNSGRPTEAPVFSNNRGQALSRDGAAYILGKYFDLAKRQAPTLRKKRITPHVLRHSCAVALLQAGVDLTVIRDYLGHESIATTGRYTQTNLETKRRVLDTFWRHTGFAPRRNSPRWAQPEMLAFLASL